MFQIWVTPAETQDHIPNKGKDLILEKELKRLNFGEGTEEEQ